MTLVFFDLETGGLDPKQHPITQIAAIAVERTTLAELERVEFKLQFNETEADPEALKVNSYDEDVWKREAYPPENALDLFAAFLRRHATTRRRSTGRSSRKRTSGSACSCRRPIACSARCSVRPGTSTSIRRLTSQSYRLETLCKYFGVQHDSAHDATGDVAATVGLYKALVPVPQTAKV